MATAEHFRKESGTKREQIMLAAVEMFIEKDYYQVRITEIAARAGVGKGTVYEYFSSKEELFKHCFTYCADAYIDSFREHLETPTLVKETMSGIVSAHLELLKNNRQKLNLLFNERPLNFQEMQTWVLERRQGLLEGISALIRKGIEQGQVRPDLDVEMAGRLFLAMNYVVIGGMAILDDIEVTEGQVTALMDIYWKGIAP